MLKHIIVLALYFVAYTIGGNPKLNPQKRKTQFDRLRTCYKQMLEYGVVKQTRVGDFTFDTLLATIYTERKSTIFNNLDGTPDISFKSIEFKNDDNLNAFKTDFMKEFVHSTEDQNQFKHILVSAGLYMPQGGLYPSNVFVLYYAHDSPKDYLRSVSSFCTEYSVRETFEEKV